MASPSLIMLFFHFLLDIYNLYVKHTIEFQLLCQWSLFSSNILLCQSYKTYFLCSSCLLCTSQPQTVVVTAHHSITPSVKGKTTTWKTPTLSYPARTCTQQVTRALLLSGSLCDHSGGALGRH